MTINIDEIINDVASELRDRHNEDDARTMMSLRGERDIAQHIKETMVAQIALTMPFEVMERIAQENPEIPGDYNDEKE